MRLGYLRVTPDRLVRRVRFNEAEAHAPRILDIGIGLRVWNANASMRPRRMRLGYQVSDNKIHVSFSVLQ